MHGMSKKSGTLCMLTVSPTIDDMADVFFTKKDNP
jgi:hypothetical protein